MKNLLFGTIVLIVFALAFALVQVSCSKSNAQTPTSNLSQLDKIVFVKWNPTITDLPTIWTANADGTNAVQIPITLPAGTTISFDLYNLSVKLSPDGQKIFFGATDTTGGFHFIYSCNIDGSNVTKICQGGTNEYVRLGGAY
jgi:Tol biopolymer transport system component